MPKTKSAIQPRYHNVTVVSGQKNTFVARVSVKGKTVQIGAFSEAILAAKASDIIMMHEWDNSSDAVKERIKFKFNFDRQTYDLATINFYQPYLSRYLARKKMIEERYHAKNLSAASASVTTSKVNGVVLCDDGTYKAQIFFNNIPITLGWFKDIVSASQAYDVVVLNIWNASNPSQRDDLEFYFDPESYNDATIQQYQPSVERYLARKETIERRIFNASNDGYISQFNGVRLRGKQYVSQITFDGKYQYLGTYKDEISAAKAYDIALLNILKSCTDEQKSTIMNNFNFNHNTYDTLTISKCLGSTPFVRSKSSVFYGVSKNDNQYRAQLSIDGNKKNLGTFTDEISAAKAVDAELLVLWQAAEPIQKAKLIKKFNFEHGLKDATETNSLNNTQTTTSETLSTNETPILPPEDLEFVPVIPFLTSAGNQQQDSKSSSSQVIFSKKFFAPISWDSLVSIENEYVAETKYKQARYTL